MYRIRTRQPRDPIGQVKNFPNSPAAHWIGQWLREHGVRQPAFFVGRASEVPVAWAMDTNQNVPVVVLKPEALFLTKQWRIRAGVAMIIVSLSNPRWFVPGMEIDSAVLIEAGEVEDYLGKPYKAVTVLGGSDMDVSGAKAVTRFYVTQKLRRAVQCDDEIEKAQHVLAIWREGD